MALVEKIGLKGTETTTARKLLASVVTDAEATAPPSYACEKQLYGAKEAFQTAPAVQNNKLMVNCHTRWPCKK